VLETSLEAARTAYGAGIYIESGYRCPHGNASLPDAVSDSLHMQGRAVDLFREGVIPHSSWTEQQFAELQELVEMEGATTLTYDTYTNHHLHAQWAY